MASLANRTAEHNLCRSGVLHACAGVCCAPSCGSVGDGCCGRSCGFRNASLCCCSSIRASEKVCRSPADVGCLLSSLITPTQGANKVRHAALKVSSKCGIPEFRGASRGEFIPLHWFNCSERYFEAMQCGGRSFLFSRRDVVTGRPGDTIAADSGASASSGASRGAVLSVDAAYSLLDWETVLRVSDRRLDLRSLGRPSVGVPAELRLSHNAAFLCHNGSTLIVYGGRRGHRAPYAGFSQVSEDVGIRRTTGKIVANADGARTIQWSQPTSVVLDGSTGRSACVERRGFDHCEFDGKLSAVRDPASGGVLLFARANTAAQARFVQVTRSADGVTRWAPWQLITFEGGGVAPGKHTNIYYFSVSAVRGSRRGAPERLVAVFPAVLPGSGGGIYLATSADGLAWSAPRRFLPSQALHGVRTADFPVAGVLRDPGGARGRFHLHIQHAVSFGKYLKSPSCRLAGVRDEPFLCRYELSERDLGGFGGSTSDTDSTC